MATPPTPTLVPASLARRMACWLYEGLVLFALMMVAVLLQSALAIVLPALNHPALLQASTLTLWGAYFVYFWQRGQTLPMKTCWIWGLPLLLQLTPWPLAVTHLSIVLGVWVVLWMLASRLHPQGQFWHDAWAKTQLLQAP